MMNLRIILLIIALVLFIASALNIQGPRVNLLAAGLAFWVLALLVSTP